MLWKSRVVSGFIERWSGRVAHQQHHTFSDFYLRLSISMASLLVVVDESEVVAYVCKIFVVDVGDAPWRQACFVSVHGICTLLNRQGAAWSIKPT